MIRLNKKKTHDINRTPDGKSLFACSQDGTVACLQLDDELVDAAPEDAIVSFF